MVALCPGGGGREGIQEGQDGGGRGGGQAEPVPHQGAALDQSGASLHAGRDMDTWGKVKAEAKVKLFQHPHPNSHGSLDTGHPRKRRRTGAVRAVEMRCSLRPGTLCLLRGPCVPIWFCAAWPWGDVTGHKFLRLVPSIGLCESRSPANVLFFGGASRKVFFKT